jgi:hypothetical protein
MMLWSVAQNVRAHVLFRSQWKLEDYLQKIFEAPSVHPALPRELNGFFQDDVKEGLKLFSGQKHFARMAFALGGVFAADVGSWYEEFCDVESLSEEDFVAVMESVSRHQHSSLKVFLDKAGARARRDDSSAVAFEAWAQALALALPRADEVFGELFSEEMFLGLAESRQISLINAFVSYVLVVQKDVKKRKSAVKVLDKVLALAKSQTVVARTLRALGQLEEVGNKTHDVLRRMCAVESLVPSCLFLIEKAPSKQSCEVLNEIMNGQPAPDSRRRMAFLKAAATQSDVNSLAGYEAFVEKCAGDADARVATEALLCIAAHPRAGLVRAVKIALSNDSIRLPATVAAKALQSEDLVDALGECLKTGSESVVGRAIDALVSLPGARAKRVVLDYWCENPLEKDLCEKIIRTLEAPPRAGEFFAQKVAAVLEAHPNHPQREGLVAMRERFLSERVATHAAELATGEVQKIDKDIAMRIPGYHRFDEDVKASLRAAEVPFYRPEMFRGAVDKSSSVIAWCKAIDLVLERHIGRKILFPKIDKTLAEFQNVLHIVGLDDPHISYTRLRQALRLENVFSDESFPGHKMVLVAQGFLSGRIVQDQWRILDGLRAWAVLILIFSRGAHLPGGKPLINLGAVAPADLEKLAKRLIALQDLRNPVAHRETWLRFPQIDEVRNEVWAVFRDWEQMVG